MRSQRFDSEGIRHVLVVDDHAPTLAAVSTLLDFEHPYIQVVGTARDAAGALRLAHEVTPDVVVLDLDLNGEDGLELIPALTLDCGAAVIILSASNDPQKRHQGFAAGAQAFISKFSPSDDLIAAVLAVQPKVAG